MLFGLSVQGNAPKFLTRVSRRGVPINSLMLSGAITSLVVLINYLLPQKAFGLLMALVVATLLLNWIMICLAHLRFRAAMRRQGRETQFKALLYPFRNYLIAFLGEILLLRCARWMICACQRSWAAGVDCIPVLHLKTPGRK